MYNFSYSSFFKKYGMKFVLFSCPKQLCDCTYIKIFLYLCNININCYLFVLFEQDFFVIFLIICLNCDV